MYCREGLFVKKYLPVISVRCGIKEFDNIGMIQILQSFQFSVNDYLFERLYSLDNNFGVGAFTSAQVYASVTTAVQKMISRELNSPNCFEFLYWLN
jgi:hypothetical protein